MFQKAKNFLKEVRTEMSRVNWPTREGVRSSTTVVIIVMLVFAVFIFFVDNVFQRLFNLLY